MNIKHFIEQATTIEEHGWGASYEHFDKEKFAELVAAHTLMNIDPKSFMTWHEGFEAGVVKEREECAKLCEKQASELYASRDTVDCAEYLAGQIRARSKA